MDEKTKKLLAKLSALSDEELGALETTLRESIDWEDKSDSNLKAVAETVEAVKQITAEKETRGTAEAEREAQLEAMKAEIAEPEPEAEEETEPEVEEEVEPITEIVAEEEEEVPEAIAASIPKPGSIRKRVPVSKQTPSTPVLGFTASVRGGAVRDGDNLSPSQLGELFSEKINGGFKGPSAVEQKLHVARMDWNSVYPEDRILDGGMRDAQIHRLQAQGMSQLPEALTAAGGLCAPLTPYYQLADISQASRPLRDSLTQFNASRGGITFNPPSQILDFVPALTDHTVDDDIAAATKNCLDVLCNEAESVNTRAIVQCLTFGNMRSRTFPEQVTEHVAKTQSAHARFAEDLLFDAMVAASTAVTSGNDVDPLGTVRTYFAALDLAADAFRSRHRTALNATLQTWTPGWFKSQVQADLIRQHPGDNTYAVADAFIQSMFAARNISNTWVLDQQVFAPQGVGALIGWADTVTIVLSHPGAFLFLDGGTLDLGITRDSTLNSTNDYQIFSETFEGLAFVGLESLAITIDTCPSGRSSGVNPDYDPCTTGS